MIRATDHAVDALALFYPRTLPGDVVREVEEGVEVERETALGLVGRRRRLENDDSRYVLHRERTGLFVVAADGGVITFLRFYARDQHLTAARLWPGGDAPTCKSTWNHPAQPAAKLLPGLGGEEAPSVSTAARDAAGGDKAAIQAAVLEAVAEGRLSVPGIFMFGRVPLAVVRANGRLRVIVPKTSSAERRHYGLLQAADLLRRNGWTCTPPEAA